MSRGMQTNALDDALRASLRGAVETACVSTESSIQRILSSVEGKAERESLISVDALIDLQATMEKLRATVNPVAATEEPSAGSERTQRGVDATAPHRLSR